MDSSFCQRWIQESVCFMTFSDLKYPTNNLLVQVCTVVIAFRERKRGWGRNYSNSNSGEISVIWKKVKLVKTSDPARLSTDRL